MADTSVRTLQLLSLLQSHRYWSGQELADRLNVSLRTLRRDVDRLRELGYPVDADRGVGGGYQMAPGAAMPPLVLDDDEAVALTVGLHLAAQATVSGIAESAVRALAKAIQVMPGRLRRRAQALRSALVSPGLAEPGPQARADTLLALAQACRDQVRAQFSYTDATERTSERTVEPVQLVVVGRRWYLVCFDTDRADWRSFRLDRMGTVQLTDRRFAPRAVPGGDAAAFVERSRSRGGDGEELSAGLLGSVEQVREQIGRWAQVTEAGTGRCRVGFPAGDLEWAAFALAATGAQVEWAEPAALREVLGDWSRQLGSVRSRP